MKLSSNISYLTGTKK